MHPEHVVQLLCPSVCGVVAGTRAGAFHVPFPPGTGLARPWGDAAASAEGKGGRAAPGKDLCLKPSFRRKGIYKGRPFLFFSSLFSFSLFPAAKTQKRISEAYAFNSSCINKCSFYQKLCSLGSLYSMGFSQSSCRYRIVLFSDALADGQKGKGRKELTSKGAGPSMLNQDTGSHLPGAA